MRRDTKRTQAASPRHRQAGLAPVARETLSRRAAHSLIVGILRGRFRPGEPLPSSGDLAAELGVSRPVVREALKILDTLGMVESRQGRASRVSGRSSWRDLSHEILAARIEIGAVDDILRESLELRRVVETEAAGLAAERATDDDLGAMRGRLEGLEGASGDPEAYAAHDVAFHDAVLGATHNRLFLQLIDSMRELLMFVRKVSVTATAGRISESLEGHRKLFAAIEARSPEAARRAMADHLRWAEQVNVAGARAARGP